MIQGSSGSDWRWGLALHHHAQNTVNARLVTPAVTLEPIEIVRIEADGKVPLSRQPRRRRLLEKRLVEGRDVLTVNIGAFGQPVPSRSS